MWISSRRVRAVSPWATGVRTWQDPALPLAADLHGAQYLRLVVTDGGDGNSYDRSDWAAARLTCG